MLPHSPKRAFSLVELSIVLVILGLLIGGVLSGKALIESASIKAQISQIEQYQVAVNSFRAKYLNVPGDMPDTIAGQLGFRRGDSVWQSTSGDGDGILNHNVGNWQHMGESGNFWGHLAQSGLVPGTYGLAHRDTNDTNVRNYLPQARLGNNMYVWAIGGGMSSNCTRWLSDGITDDGYNYFSLVGFERICGWNGCMPTTYTPMKVSTAHNMDQKLDDGLPTSGRILTKTVMNGVFQLIGERYCVWGLERISTNPTPGSATTCYDNNNVNGATQQYSIGQNGGSNQTCAVSFRFVQ